jgi:hypothetical protein
MYGRSRRQEPRDFQPVLEGKHLSGLPKEVLDDVEGVFHEVAERRPGDAQGEARLKCDDPGATVVGERFKETEEDWRLGIPDGTPLEEQTVPAARCGKEGIARIPFCDQRITLLQNALFRRLREQSNAVGSEATKQRKLLKKQ